MACNGNCAACGGCARELEITGPELEVLNLLSQIPFLPVERELGGEEPISPDAEAITLLCLEKKGLISIDYSLPIKGYAYGNHPVCGSFALTERGQKVLELIEYQGIL